jgi:uncharacterized membrane protein YesL
MEVLIGILSASGFMVILFHIPLYCYSNLFNLHYSPRLWATKGLSFFDGLFNFIVIIGSIFGLVLVTGVGMIIHNVIMVLSISLAIFATKKWLVPKWKSDYERLKATKIAELSSARKQHA